VKHALDIDTEGVTDEKENDPPGMFLPVNNNFDEGNMNTGGNPEPDNYDEDIDIDKDPDLRIVILRQNEKLKGEKYPNGNVKIYPLNDVRLEKGDCSGDIKIYRQNTAGWAPFDMNSNLKTDLLQGDIILRVEGMTTGEVHLKLKPADSDENKAWWVEDEVLITIPKVDLEWEEMKNEAEEVISPLTANDHPEAPAGTEGLKIFPGKQTPTDTTARNTVKLKAHVTLAVAGQKVFFKIYDVSDPSLDTTIDPNYGWGDDNRGTPKTGTLVLENDGITDENGDATAIFTTTMQPGDNFRAIASIINDTTGDHTPQMVLGFDPATEPVTQTLTVWRRLHIEQDTWRKPTTAEITFQGAALTAVPDTPIVGRTTINLGTNLPDSFDDENMFEEGTITFTGFVTSPKTFLIVTNTSNILANDEIVIEGIPSTEFTINSSYVLRDDDDPDVLPHFPDPGAMGVNAFKDAYIDLVIMGAEYRDTIDYFNLNVNYFEALGTGWSSGKDLTTKADFWVHYVVGGFQGNQDEDFDSDGLMLTIQQPHIQTETESPAYGFTHPNDERTLIFLETIRDRLVNSNQTDEAHVVTHEIGHGVGDDSIHADGGIMSEEAPNQFNSFSPTTIVRMRSIKTYGDPP
jgi:hypothetical protein